jgi:hypothetical protein
MYCILPMYEFGNTFYSPSYTTMILLRCIQFTQRQRYCGSTLQMSFFLFLHSRCVFLPSVITTIYGSETLVECVEYM